jgi:hypothetical protein
MSIRDRLGFDAGGMGLEDALAWAARFGEVRLADNLYLAAC